MEEAERLEVQRKDLEVLKRMQQELSRHRVVNEEERTLRYQEAPGAPAVSTTMQGADRGKSPAMVSTPQPGQHHAEAQSSLSDVLAMNQDGASGPDVPTTTSDGNTANQSSPLARYGSQGIDSVVVNEPDGTPPTGDVENEESPDTRTVATPKEAIPTRNENGSSDAPDGTRRGAGSGSADAAKDHRPTA